MSKVFGDNLRAYRTLARMTQTDLATAAGITRSAVNNYEAAKSEPSFEILCRFADILGVSITDLVEEKTVPNYVRRIQVTDREAFLLDIFRGADSTYQGVAIDILRAHQKEER